MTKITKMITWDGGALGSIRMMLQNKTRICFLVFWATRMKDIG
jgi:hypothetical protein